MKEYLKIIGLSLIPTFLIYIGKTDGFFTFLHKHGFISPDDDIEEMKLGCFLVGILWSGLIVPAQFAKTKKELERQKGSFQELLAFNKQVLLASLKKKIRRPTFECKTVIFVPKRNWQNRFKKVRELKIKKIQGFTDSSHDDSLIFQTHPQIQGIVGKCFETKKIIVDCSILSPERHVEYNLTHYHISKTSEIRFCCSSPIFDNKNNVKAVVSIESSEEVNLDDKQTQDFRNFLIRYSAFIDKHINFKI